MTTAQMVSIEVRRLSVLQSQAVNATVAKIYAERIEKLLTSF